MKKYILLFMFVLLIILSGCNKEDNNKGDDEVEKISITFVGDGIEDNEIYIDKGSTYDLPSPERNGYNFIVWINTATGDIIDNTYIFEEDTFLEASWNKKTMHIIYYKYGNVNLKDETYYEEDNYEMYQPTLDGYTFVGWYSDENLTKEVNLKSSSTVIYAYAKFNQNMYKISFDHYYDEMNVLYNNRIGALPKITVSSCTFEGWEYNGQVITATTLYTLTEDITLKAILKTKTTFDVEGVSTPVIYYIGDNTPYAKAIKDGYIFAGWYLNSDLSGDAIYKIDDTSCAGKTLYAKFVSSDDENNSYSTKLVEMVADYYDELYNNKVLYENIELPKDDIYYGCSLNFESNNRAAIQNNGIITRTKVNQEAELKLTVRFGEVSKEITLNVTVKANPYKDIDNTKIISCYVYTGTFNSRPVDDILLNTVDIINYSFVEPNADGTITISQDYLTKLNKFKDSAKEKGVRIIMTVSGTHDNATDLATIASNDETRAIFVASIIELIVKYDFAGVDIDWEYPTDSGTKYTTLMTDIYNGVKAYDKELLVTSAIPAGPFSYSKYGLKNSSKYLDYINMMSYDMGCEQMYHHAALYKSSMTYSGCSVDESVTVFKNLGVPLDKIIIGAAFYGRKTEVTSFNYNSSSGTASGNVNKNGTVGASLGYTSIYNNYINNNANAKVYWDNTAKANYIYDSNAKLFITYESEKSLDEKCKYVVSKGVKGIMWWDYGSDATGNLIQEMNKNLSILK